jgi:hypothetical protein
VVDLKQSPSFGEFYQMLLAGFPIAGQVLGMSTSHHEKENEKDDDKNQNHMMITILVMTTKIVVLMT